MNQNECELCGASANKGKENTYSNEKLLNIFNGVYRTLYMHSKYSEKEFEEEFEEYKHYKNRVMSDNDYYQSIVDVIFYSGFKAATVEKYLGRIHEHFSDYKTVSKYFPEKIAEIKDDPKMLKNKSKIDACVRNAKKVEEIVGEYGSMKAYMDSFEPNVNDEALYKFKNSIEREFDYLGDVTSYHFMTDIGLNVLKPDRVILRIFNRLGLIENEKDLIGAVKAGRAFSEATGLPIRFIDIIFVLYGQLNQEMFDCICSEKNPKCNECGIRTECLYAKEAELIFDER